MISEIDIKDWDRESKTAYLQWAKNYGLSHEPIIGFPSQYAAWKAAVDWTVSEMERGLKKGRE